MAAASALPSGPARWHRTQCLSKTGWTSRSNRSGQEPSGASFSFDGARRRARACRPPGAVVRGSWQPAHDSVVSGWTYVTVRMVWTALPAASRAWKNTIVPAGTRK